MEVQPPCHVLDRSKKPPDPRLDIPMAFTDEPRQSRAFCPRGLIFAGCLGLDSMAGRSKYHLYILIHRARELGGPVQSHGTPSIGHFAVLPHYTRPEGWTWHTEVGIVAFGGASSWLYTGECKVLVVDESLAPRRQGCVCRHGSACKWNNCARDTCWLYVRYAG